MVVFHLYQLIFIKIKFYHIGSKLIGPLETKPDELQHEKHWLYTHLPSSAEDIKLYDEIGHIYNKKTITYDDHITMRFQARFALLSGWKTNYKIQYTVAMHEYLFSEKSSHYQLKMRAVDHVLNNIVIDTATTKIVLPQGAHILKVQPPPGFERLEDEKIITSLNYNGRPTVVLRGRKIMEVHIAPFVVDYYYPSFNLLKIPIAVSIYVFVGFAVVVFYNRVDFGLK